MTRAVLIGILSLITFSSFAENNLSKKYSSVLAENSGSFQETIEIDGYRNTLYLSPSVSYITPNQLEISFQSQNLRLAGDQVQNYEGDSYAGLAKFFKINDKNALVVSSQLGMSPNDNSHLHSFSYVDYRHRPVKWFIIHGGAFYVNSALSTTTSYVGGLAGIEFNREDAKLSIDYYGGHTNVSGGTSILTIKKFKWFRPYFGVGFPERLSGNEFYGIAGISFIQ